MTNFYRACPKHRDELVEVDRSVTGHERLKCPQGHTVTSWLVLAEDGDRIGRAWIDRQEMVVGEPLVEIPKKKIPVGKPPFRQCIHGHLDWGKTTDGKWICRPCQKETWTKQNLRRSREKKELLNG
jgi:hypothetical protein